MIEVIKIKNYILIDEAEIDLSNGFNVITGETGSGKSLFIGALNLISGAKADNSVIGKYGTECSVEISLKLDKSLRNKLINLDILDNNYSENSIIIKRIIGSKNKSYINGNLVSQKQLSEIVAPYFQICSQHENQQLLNKDYQLNLLDEYSEIESDLLKIKEIFLEISYLKEEKKSLTEKLTDTLNKKDYYEFQLEEINSLNVTKEDENIEKTISDLKNKNKIKELSDIINENIHSSLGVKNKLKETIISLRELLNLNVIDKEIFESIDKEFSEFISSSLSKIPKVNISFDEDLINFYMKRIDELSKIKRKYGSVSEILSKKDELESLINIDDSFNEKIEEINLKINSSLKEYKKISKKISEIRKKKAEVFQKNIESNLKDLGMKNVQFKIDLKQKEDSYNGNDEIEFKFSPNLAEEILPISEIASGGELSRVILSINNVLNKNNSSYLFDEVDSGIGGNTGSMIGRKLKEMSKRSQVICITHLPQVAVFGDNHLKIEKVELKNKTTSRIIKISMENDIVEEISRMLGSSLGGAKSLENAKEMIKNAKK